MDRKEIERQFDAIWKKLDETHKLASQASSLAQHADKGFIELNSEMKTVRQTIEQQNKDINGLGSKFEEFTEKIRDKLTKNLAWTIGIIFALLTLYSGLIILVITNKN